MNVQEILAILIPLLGAMAWAYSRIEKRFEAMEKRFEAMEKRFDRFEDLLQNINTRLTRLEGRFDERGYWEAREFRKTGTEEK